MSRSNDSGGASLDQASDLDVEIFEVGPRDGLQNEPGFITIAQKVALVDRLSRVGFRRIEAGAFVSPRWVPQMADSDAVFERISRADGVIYTALTPNLRGFERALSAGAQEVAIFTAASEAFARANISASIAESLERFVPVMDAAKLAGIPVRGYVSTVVHCPYAGDVEPSRVCDVARMLKALGCYAISLGDTTGRGTPERIGAMLDAVLEHIAPEDLAGHYHDTGGHALDNVEASLRRGLRVFDAAVGGLGGCPYAPGASGNVATEALAARLTALGYAHGLDLAQLQKASALARALRHQETGVS